MGMWCLRSRGWRSQGELFHKKSALLSWGLGKASRRGLPSLLSALLRHSVLEGVLDN